jgi:hypothetical protein
MHQDLVDQIVVQEILVDQELIIQMHQDLVDQIVVQEILVDQDLVDQTEDQVVQEILAQTDQVAQVEFQQCLVFNHQDVLVNAVVQVVAETQLVLLVVKAEQIKNVQNQNVKNVKSLKISWKHHNLVVCNYQKVMAEQFV